MSGLSELEQGKLIEAVESLEKQVKTLGTDCAYLQKQNETLKVKLKEQNEKSFYRNKKFRRN